MMAQLVRGWALNEHEGGNGWWGSVVWCLGRSMNARGTGSGDLARRVGVLRSERTRGGSWMAGHLVWCLGRLTNPRGPGVSDVARRGACCGALRTREA